MSDRPFPYHLGPWQPELGADNIIVALKRLIACHISLCGVPIAVLKRVAEPTYLEITM